MQVLFEFPWSTKSELSSLSSLVLVLSLDSACFELFLRFSLLSLREHVHHSPYTMATISASRLWSTRSGPFNLASPVGFQPCRTSP